MMKKIFGLILILFINIYIVNSEIKELVVNGQDLFDYPSKIDYLDSKSKLPKTLTIDNQVKPISINEAKAGQFFNNQVDKITISNFPLSTEDFGIVELKKATPAVQKGTRWIRHTASGEIMGESIEPGFYTGKISGNENSNVTVLYYKGYLYSIIEREGFDNYSITPVSEGTKKGDHLLTSQGSSSQGDNYNPFLDLHFNNLENDGTYEEFLNKNLKIQSNDLLLMDIIIEVTWDFYRLFNDYDKCVAYISAVLSHSSQIYERDLYITQFISMVEMHEDQATDPYNGTTQLYDRLMQVQENWRAKTVKRSLVCLMTDIDYQGGSGGYRVGGISWSTKTLCKYSEAYCVFGMQGHFKYPTSNYTWDVAMAAHEIGHASGSAHTHSCYFRIDTCITRNEPQPNSDGCETKGSPIPRPGTIMSYCHLTNSTKTVGLFFHEKCIDVIRKYVENASCIKKAIDPTLILLQPYGGTVIFPGEKIPIRWASSKIESIAIKFSLDGGITWTWINKDIPAKDGEYLWEVPDTITSKLVIFIQDAYNSEVFDYTEPYMSIDKPTLQLVAPIEGDRIGKDENYDITWISKYLTKVKIEFTSESNKINDGNDNIWTLVAIQDDGNKYKWDVPDILSQTCKLRLTGFTEKGTPLVIYSGQFSIGEAFCTLTAPIGGEHICAGQTFQIKWESDFISSLYFQYSIDGGTKWNQVRFGPIPALDKKYDWKVPEKYTSTALIRVTPYYYKENILSVTPETFLIDSCAMDVNDIFYSQDKGIIIKEILPNPAQDFIKIIYEKNENSSNNIEISIINVIGEKTLLGTIDNANIGENHYSIALPNLSQGSYYILLNSGDSQTGKLIRIKK